MKLYHTHEKLLDAIKERVPQKQIADKLVDILCIEREAIYRRLRGEVFFTLEETTAIAIKLGISIDIIIGGCSDPDNRPFQLKTTKMVSPSIADYKQMAGWIEILENIIQSPDLVVGGCGNAFDLVLFYPFSYLSNFYHFKWEYQWRGIENFKHFKEIIITEKQRKLQQEYVRLSKQIKKTYYIWDHMIFQYIINDILYFRNVRLIDKDDVANIKNDLLDFIDLLESIARKGCYETGSKIELYISNINSDATYTFYQCENFNLSMIKAFTLTSLASTDLRATNEIKKWILSQKRLATQISESGEMQRINFFKTQRELVNDI